LISLYLIQFGTSNILGPNCDSVQQEADSDDFDGDDHSDRTSDKACYLSASAQTFYKIVSSQVDAATDGYVIEVVVAEQIQFADGRIAPCFSSEPAEEPPWIESVTCEYQLQVSRYPFARLICLVLIDGKHDALLQVNRACIRLRIPERRRPSFRDTSGFP
jgi:hypothetical protein